MICPQCRAETPESLDRCVVCGASLGGEPDATVASQPPVSSLGSAETISAAAPGGPSPQSPSAIGMFAPGNLFAGRYRIKSTLGAGGMGAVYEAWDQELGVTIALKVIRTEVIIDPEAARDYARRFKQELLLARQVSHPNVVRIHDMGDAAGIKYITMSYIEGSDLGSLLKDGPLPTERTRAFAIQLLAGLAAAHDVGIVHRDLKPQNILIDARDHLCISDFGLAKSLEPTAAGLTRTGEFLGTPRYISPEQVQGQPADHRGDIYAVGLILYEMVTGDAPFSGASAMEMMLQRVQQRPNSARSKNPNVPEYFDRIIMRCLEKDPAARYQNAHDVLADLRGERSTAGSGGLGSRRTVSWTMPVPSKRVGIIAAIAASLVVFALALPSTRRALLPSTSTRSAAPVTAARLAVLPFKVLGDTPALAAAAAGIEEALASKLFQVKSVNVTSATVVQRALQNGTPLERMAREVGAAFLVSGTVQGTPEKLRITVHLDDDRQRRIWSQDFPGVPADLLTIQDAIFRELVPNLNLSMSSGEQAATIAHPTENIDAYAAYLEGRRAMRNDQDIEQVKSAIASYERALQKDPRFALAYAGIADSSIRMYRSTKDPAWTAKAQSAALQAQSLDPSLIEVRLSLGNVYQEVGKTAEAIVELKRATELMPNSDDAHRRLGRAYLAVGRGKEAIEAYRTAVRINPYLWVNSASLGLAYVRVADYDSAIEAFRKVTELAPDNVNGHNDLGAVFLQAGRPAEAIPAFERALKLKPIPNTYSNLGVAYAQAGKFTEAVPMFEEAVKLEPKDQAFVGNLADGYRWAGQPEKAAAEYDKAIALAQQALQVNPRAAAVKGSLALYYAKKGQSAQARRFINDARTIDKSDVGLIYTEAVVCAILNDPPCAVSNLELALKQGYTVPLIESDPDLRRLRDDPSYQALKARAARSASPR